MDDKKERVFYNRSLERALRILCAFNADRQSLTQGQLADLVKLPRATVVRLCSTLIEFDFLRFDEQMNCYSLGLKLFELGSVVFSTFSLRRVVSPYLTQLQLKLAKTVFLGIIEDDEVAYIDKREDPRNFVRFASNIGTRRPPFFGMLGQVLMAFLPDVEVNRMLQRKPLAALTNKAITDEIRFKERLAVIRKNGFVVEDGEAIPGVAGIAAPIRDFAGRVVGAIGVGFISSSEDENGRYAIIKEVVNTAYDISQDLGNSEGIEKAGSRAAEWRAE